MKKNDILKLEIQKSQVLYQEHKNRSTESILERYAQGKINRYQYILEMHENHSCLFEISNLLKNQDIESISIESNCVKFKLNKSNLTFIVDNGCRSPLFETLNFGSYEQQEMHIIQQLIQEDDVVFDVGAHLGWYSLHLASLYKNALFYAFEPMPKTYHLLERNISLNNLLNVKSFNFGFSSQQKTTSFYYSEVGSAIASEQDIFEIGTLDKKECHLKKIDDFVLDNKINKIDFIKCDVEGAEFLVIKGGEISIKKFHPILFIELVENWCNKFGYTIEEISKFLSNMGYKIFEFKNDYLIEIKEISIENIDNFNYLFLHEEKHLHLIRKFSNT